MSSGIMREAMMHGMLVFIDDETLYCAHCGVVVPGGKTTHPPYCGERCAHDAAVQALRDAGLHRHAEVLADASEKELDSIAWRVAQAAAGAAADCETDEAREACERAFDACEMLDREIRIIRAEVEKAG